MVPVVQFCKIEVFDRLNSFDGEMLIDLIFIVLLIFKMWIFYKIQLLCLNFFIIEYQFILRGSLHVSILLLSISFIHNFNILKLIRFDFFKILRAVTLIHIDVSAVDGF